LLAKDRNIRLEKVALTLTVMPIQIFWDDKQFLQSTCQKISMLNFSTSNIVFNPLNSKSINILLSWLSFTTKKN